MKIMDAFLTSAAVLNCTLTNDTTGSMLGVLVIDRWLLYNTIWYYIWYYTAEESSKKKCIIAQIMRLNSTQTLGISVFPPIITVLV